jgi:hypothetical protein
MLYVIENITEAAESGLPLVPGPTFAHRTEGGPQKAVEWAAGVWRYPKTLAVYTAGDVEGSTIRRVYTYSESDGLYKLEGSTLTTRDQRRLLSKGLWVPYPEQAPIESLYGRRYFVSNDTSFNEVSATGEAHELNQGFLETHLDTYGNQDLVCIAEDLSHGFVVEFRYDRSSSGRLVSWRRRDLSAYPRLKVAIALLPVSILTTTTRPRIRGLRRSRRGEAISR